jgi:hypothetical protein
MTGSHSRTVHRGGLLVLPACQVTVKFTSVLYRDSGKRKTRRCPGVSRHGSFAQFTFKIKTSSKFSAPQRMDPHHGFVTVDRHGRPGRHPGKPPGSAPGLIPLPATGRLAVDELPQLLQIASCPGGPTFPFLPLTVFCHGAIFGAGRRHDHNSKRRLTK